MNPPVKNGTRIVVGDNLHEYAKAIVTECIYVPNEQRWGIVLEWPNAPGGSSFSRVWDTDEGKVWRRFSDVN